MEELILKRSYKEVYKLDNTIVKLFSETHPKAAVFNEALNTARVEETGLNIPKVISVHEVKGKWALTIELKEGKTLEQLMQENPEKTEDYMEQFVELQLSMHAKKAPKLKKLKDKLNRQINGLKIIDATTRYELLTRLESMPKHDKLCHGDFNPSNVIVGEDGSMSIVDWAHATQGNASADAAYTYLLFALKDQCFADMYMDIFCKKSDTAKQYVHKWLPIVAAAQLSKENEQEKDFLLSWIDIIDFQ